MFKYTVIITPEGEFPISFCQIIGDEVLITDESYGEVEEYLFKLSDCKTEERTVNVFSNMKSYKQHCKNVEEDRHARYVWVGECAKKASSIVEELFPYDKIKPGDIFCNIVFGDKIYENEEEYFEDIRNGTIIVNDSDANHPFLELFMQAQEKYRRNPYLPNEKELDHLGYKTQDLIDYWRKDKERQVKWKELEREFLLEKPEFGPYW